jgi:hypothetical protein
MPVMSSNVEHATAQRPHYWFAIMVWIAVIAASVVAVTAAVANAAV